MDKNTCIQWVGETYLEANAPTEKRAIGRTEFLNAWKDLVPETWRAGTVLSNLPVSHVPLRKSNQTGYDQTDFELGGFIQTSGPGIHTFCARIRKRKGKERVSGRCGQ